MKVSFRFPFLFFVVFSFFAKHRSGIRNFIHIVRFERGSDVVDPIANHKYSSRRGLGMSTLNRGRDRVKVRVTRLRGLAKASRRVGTASQLDGRVQSGFSCV